MSQKQKAKGTATPSTTRTLSWREIGFHLLASAVLAASFVSCHRFPATRMDVYVGFWAFLLFLVTGIVRVYRSELYSGAAASTGMMIFWSGSMYFNILDVTHETFFTAFDHLSWCLCLHTIASKYVLPQGP